MSYFNTLEKNRTCAPKYFKGTENTKLKSILKSSGTGRSLHGTYFPNKNTVSKTYTEDAGCQIYEDLDCEVNDRSANGKTQFNSPQNENKYCGTSPYLHGAFFRNKNPISKTYTEDAGCQIYEDLDCEVNDRSANGKLHLKSPQNEKKVASNKVQVHEDGASVKPYSVRKEYEIPKRSVVFEQKMDLKSTLSRMEVLALNPETTTSRNSGDSRKVKNNPKYKISEDTENSSSSSDQLNTVVRPEKECVLVSSPRGNSVVLYNKERLSNKQNVMIRERSKADIAYTKLQEKLQNNFEALSTFLPAATTSTLISLPYNLMVKYQDEETKQMVTGVELLENMSQSSRKILVQGLPGFGKTTLCHILARMWSSLLKNKMSFFKLCFLANLSKMNVGSDLEEQLVTCCTAFLNDSEFGPDVVKDVLTAKSGNIFLLLDGYDTLAAQDQTKVCTFLKSSVVFSNSYILVTTSPTSDKDFLEIFDRHASIRGFSKEYLRRLLQPEPLPNFTRVFSDQQLAYLSDLSPNFISIVADFWKEKLYKNQKGGSLYELLDCMIQLLLSSNRTPDVSPDLILKLGEQFFHSLVQKKTFNENELKILLGDAYEHFITCNIFYLQREDRKLVVSSKILVVFLAVMYLRNRWANLADDVQRLKFLKDVQGYGSCSGDYVPTEDGSLCFAGLIPDIVLKYGSSHLLKDSTIEMYCDVDRINPRYATDSVYSLVTVTNKELRRIGFESRAMDDSSFVAMLGDIFDFLPIDFPVPCRFYHNAKENKSLFLIKAEDDLPDILLSVLKPGEDGTLERAYIDFAYYEGVFAFVNTFLSKYRKDYELPVELTNSSLSDFVQGLIFQMWSSRTDQPATITCESDAGYLSQKVKATFIISSDMEIEGRLLCVAVQSSLPDNSHLPFLKYQICESQDAAEQIHLVMEYFMKSLAGVRITINLL